MAKPKLTTSLQTAPTHKQGDFIAQLKQKRSDKAAVFSPLNKFDWKTNVASAPGRVSSAPSGTLNSSAIAPAKTNLQGELPRTAGGNLDIAEIRTTFTDQMNRARRSRSKGA